MVILSDDEADRLTTGAAVTAVVERGTLTEGDEIELGDAFSAVVEAVDPEALGETADPGSASSETRDLVVLRVYGAVGPVLDDGQFEDMRRDVEGGLRG